jgi:hypothetical protein
MKSRTALLERNPAMRMRPAVSIPSLVAISSRPMGPDCDEDCPYCQGPETD